VIYPGSTPVGNATFVVANVLTCNKHSQLLSSCVGSLTLRRLLLCFLVAMPRTLLVCARLLPYMPTGVTA
jgi:hypothetical protein